MEQLYDMHCHILPGVDDGAPDEYTMMKMVRIAYNEGIRTILMTPHYHPYRGSADAETVMQVFGKSYSLIKHYYPDMEVYEGCEIYFQRDIISKLKNGELLTLAGSKYALIEFSTDVECSYVRDALSEVLFAGFIPVIAHIERYPYVQKNPNIALDWIEAGAYLQVNADSIVGDTMQRNFVYRLIKHGVVHVIASDTHSPDKRPPQLTKAMRLITRKFDNAVGGKLECNAQSLFNGDAPDVEQPVPISKWF